MTELDSRYVYRGFWVNQNDGLVMGRTITVDSKTSTIIVALLAVLSSLGAAHLWNILLFITHLRCANGKPANALIRQRQAIIRTMPTPASLAAEILKLWWSWRRKGRGVLTQCLLPTLFPLCFAVSALFTSIFSSYIITSSNVEVLVQSPFCGPINEWKLWDDQLLFSSSNYMAIYETNGEEYALDCYENLDSLPTKCRDIFIRPSIPFSISKGKCILASSPCPPEALRTVVLDSGLLDMNEHFGLNLPVTDGVEFRRKSTCTVLPSDEHIRIVNSSDIEFLSADPPGPPFDLEPGEKSVAMLYGPIGNSKYEGKPEWKNLTFAKRILERKAATGFSSLAVIDGFRNDSSKEYYALPELAQEDANVVIWAIFPNKIFYKEPVDDPVFSAHIEWISFYGAKRYLPDQLGRAIGCTVQYQVCIHQSGQNRSCTALGKLDSSGWQNDLPEANSVQLALLWALNRSSRMMDLSNVGKLEASRKANRGTLTSLPADQWEIEVAAQESKVWATLQILIADYAIGAQASEPGARVFVDPPTTAGEKQLCKSQKMRKAGGFANINVLGLVLIVTLSSIIILIDMILLKFLIYLRQFRQRLAPKIDRWIQDGVLQFQRRAYEVHGQGRWMDLKLNIPTTPGMEKLSDLPLESLPQPQSNDNTPTRLKSSIEDTCLS